MREKDLVEEILNLKLKLKEKEAELDKLLESKKILQKNGLNNSEIARYSRQMLLPDIGVQGQIKLKNSSILIVGAGGLGCPSALYLAGAGIGHIGIIDYDVVEITNLHRQLLFSTYDIGISKAAAAEANLKRLNNDIKITPYNVQINSKNALDIIANYDVVLDATDNVATRYLLNDACVIAKKPLVSGSALQFEGQLTVYNYNGPCYRCIFPKPPPPETVNNCGDSGVLGAVVGSIGVLQALQAIKIVLQLPGILSGRLLMFDGIDFIFRNLKLRAKNPDCAVCGINSTIQKLIDYEEFCGAKANDKNPNLRILENNERISVEDYFKLQKSDCNSHLLLDVRSNEEFQMCHLENFVNLPISQVYKLNDLNNFIKQQENKNSTDTSNIFVLCRRGNDSQKAVKYLKKLNLNSKVEIKDIIGGLHEWSKKIDSTFPIY